jgi:hypothetical protein
MQSLFEIGQLSDESFKRAMNNHLATCDDKQEKLEARIKELKEEYFDEDDQIFDVLISEEWAGEVQPTIRAMVNAHRLGNHKSWEAFAKSLTQSIIEGVERKAKFMAEREKNV